MRNKQFQQLNLSERVEIYALFKQGISLRIIAKKLDRDVGTISRELKRNRSRWTKIYEAVKAHQIALNRASDQRTKAPLKNLKVFLYVRNKLRTDKWSPETIAGRLPIDHPEEHICFETIYQYVHGKGKRFKLWKHLTHTRKKRKRMKGRGVKKEIIQSRIPNAISIDLRLKRANDRSQAGHFETDLMEGKRSQKTALSVLVDRKTRHTLLGKVQNKTALEKQKVLTIQLKGLQSLEKSDKPIVKSVTTDNGSENTNHQEVSESTGVRFYFCHPYHSWEKGTVENMIGRVRRYVPKGTNIHKLTDIQIQWLENKLNNTPRKVLGFRTPNEVMEKELNRYKFRKLKKQKEESVAFQLRM